VTPGQSKKQGQGGDFGTNGGEVTTLNRAVFHPGEQQFVVGPVLANAHGNDAFRTGSGAQTLTRIGLPNVDRTVHPAREDELTILIGDQVGNRRGHTHTMLQRRIGTIPNPYALIHATTPQETVAAHECQTCDLSRMARQSGLDECLCQVPDPNATILAARDEDFATHVNGRDGHIVRVRDTPVGVWMAGDLEFGRWLLRRLEVPYVRLSGRRPRQSGNRSRKSRDKVMVVDFAFTNCAVEILFKLHGKLRIGRIP
jgi:hypothetical protein